MTHRWSLVLAALVLVVASGCGTSIGLLRDSNTQVHFSEANFEYSKKAVTVRASVGHLLCVIPLDIAPSARLMKDLHDKADLQPNETFVNFRQDLDIRTYAIFWCEMTHTLSADVVRFLPKS